MDLYHPLHYILNAAIMKYPPHSQNSLNVSKKIKGNGLISPLALYIIMQGYISPCIFIYPPLHFFFFFFCMICQELKIQMLLGI